MTDEELVEGFESCTFPAAEFNHAAHIRAARWYLERYGFDEAFERFSTALIRFATAAGKPEKYDAEVTLKYMREIARELGR